MLAAPFEDGFVIPLTYGAHVDWCRNVLIAGHCTLLWRGEGYQIARPQIIDMEDAINAFSPMIQQMLRRNEVSQVLQVAVPHDL